MRAAQRRKSPFCNWFVAIVLAASSVPAQEILLVSEVDPADTIRLDASAFTNPLLQFTDGNDTGTIRFYRSPARFDFLGAVEYILNATGSADVRLGSDGGVILHSENPSQRYLADSDDDDGFANHIWYENAIGGPTDYRMMQLTQEDGGDLLIAGQLTSNHMFDIAETFWETTPVEPGQLVAVDPRRPDAVRLTTEAYAPSLLGVASSNPGVVLGGGAFSVEELRQTWGPEIAEEFQNHRPLMELEVFNEHPDLLAEAERLSSQSRFEAQLDALETERLPLGEEGYATERSFGSSRYASAPELAAAYEAAKWSYEELMFDLTVRRFFEKRFSAVALAGRVPVKADASFGSIRPGDYLTASPVPGVAMRATRSGPVVGTALESLDSGAGVIQVFVHRGWYGGDGVSIAAKEPVSGLRPDPRDIEIADLRRKLAAVEERLERLAGDDLSARLASLPNEM